MKITGELLKSERLKQNMSVNDVASSLKLSSRIITSIESGDVSELPAKTFIRGFVKSYAQLLKLDSDLILRQFLEEMGSTQPLPKVPPPQATDAENRAEKSRQRSSPSPTTNLDINQDHTKKTFAYIAIAIVLLAVILVINNVVDKYQKEAQVDSSNVAQVQPLQQNESVLAPTPDATVAATETSAPLVKPDVTATPPTAADPAKTSDTAKPADVPVSDLAITTTAPNDFEPSLGKPVELIVEAKKEVEFFYAKGNTKNFVRVKLSPKEIQVIRSPSGLHLKAEDGSSLNLILNGVEKGQAASSSKPVRLTF